jgi:hypothetical protein
MVGKYLRSRLLDSTPVNNLINGRFHPIWIPQLSDKPAVAFSCTITPGDATKIDRATYDNYDVTLNIWGDDYDQLDAIDMAIRNELDFTRGTTEGITVKQIEYQGGSDTTDEKGEFICREARYRVSVVR